MQASPRVVWATLHDPAATAALYPELHLGSAGAVVAGRIDDADGVGAPGLLRERARIESLEARPRRSSGCG